MVAVALVLVAILAAYVLIAAFASNLVAVPFNIAENAASAAGRRRARVSTSVELAALAPLLAERLDSTGGSVEGEGNALQVRVAGQSVAVVGTTGGVRLRGTDAETVEKVTGMLLSAARESDPEAHLRR